MSNDRQKYDFIRYVLNIELCKFSSLLRLSETPPPPNTWQVSPVARHSLNSTGTSPLRRSSGNNSASSPLLTGPLAVLGSPTAKTLQDNNNTLRHSPVIPFGTRAVTLPEISGNISYFSYRNPLNILKNMYVFLLSSPITNFSCCITSTIIY